MSSFNNCDADPPAELTQILSSDIETEVGHRTRGVTDKKQNTGTSLPPWYEEDKYAELHKLDRPVMFNPSVKARPKERRPPGEQLPPDLAARVIQQWWRMVLVHRAWRGFHVC